MADPIPGATDAKVTPPADEGKKGEGAPGAEQKLGADGKPIVEDKGAAKPAANLFEGGPDESAPKLDAEGKPIVEKPADKPLDPNDPNAWLLAEGVMGSGAKPEWFKSDKYKSVEEQAKAYPDLEKRFGSFKGAPKDGKYEAPKMPEGIEGEFLTDHPVLQEFNKWAAESQLSQEGYNSVMGLLAQYEASHVPDIAAIKQSLGADADKRIGAVTGWAKANLTREQFAVYREVGKTAEAGRVLQLMESVIAKARGTTTPPKVGDDVAAAAPGDELERIAVEHGKKGPDGKLLYNTDPAHRARVEKAYNDYYAKQK